MPPTTATLTGPSQQYCNPSAQFTVTLDSAAPSGGTVINIASSCLGDTFQSTFMGANVTSITIPQSQTVGNFWITPGAFLGFAPSITSANAVTFTVGTAGTFTVTATGTPPISISKAGALPTGVSFTDNGNGTATIAGTPASGTNTSSPYTITITAANGIGSNATQGFTITDNLAGTKTLLQPSDLTYAGYYVVSTVVATGVEYGQMITHRYVGGQLRFLIGDFQTSIPGSNVGVCEFALPTGTFGAGQTITTAITKWAANSIFPTVNSANWHTGLSWEDLGGGAGRLWTTQGVDYAGEGDVIGTCSISGTTVTNLSPVPNAPQTNFQPWWPANLPSGVNQFGIWNGSSYVFYTISSVNVPAQTLTLTTSPGNTASAQYLGKGWLFAYMASSVAVCNLDYNGTAVVSNWQGYWGFQEPNSLVNGAPSISHRCVFGRVIPIPSYIQTNFGLNAYMIGIGGYASLSQQGGSVSLGLFGLTTGDLTTSGVAPLAPSAWNPNTNVNNAGGDWTVPTNKFKIVADHRSGGNSSTDWYDSNKVRSVLSGTITTTLGSTTVTGTGTGFTSAMNGKWIMICAVTSTSPLYPTGGIYQVASVAGTTILTLTLPILSVDVVSAGKALQISYTGSPTPSSFDRGGRGLTIINYFDAANQTLPNYQGGLSPLSQVFEVSTTVNVSGTSVTNIGDNAQGTTMFQSWWIGYTWIIGGVSYSVSNLSVKINGTPYTVTQVQDPDHMTIATSAGTLTGASLVGPSTRPQLPPPDGSSWQAPAPDGLARGGETDSYNNSGDFVVGPNKYGFLALAGLEGGATWYTGGSGKQDTIVAEIHGYDPADFAAVAAGTKNPWNVQPNWYKDISPDFSNLLGAPSTLAPVYGNARGGTFDINSTPPRYWVWIPLCPGQSNNCLLVCYNVNC